MRALRLSAGLTQKPKITIGWIQQNVKKEDFYIQLYQVLDREKAGLLTKVVNQRLIDLCGYNITEQINFVPTQKMIDSLEKFYRNK